MENNATLTIGDSPACLSVKLYIFYTKINNNITIVEKKNLRIPLLSLKNENAQLEGTFTILRYLHSTFGKDDSKLLISRINSLETIKIFELVNFCLKLKNLKKYINFLNTQIHCKTFFVGNSLSIADIVIYAHLLSLIDQFDTKKTISLARWFDFLQNTVGISVSSKPVKLKLETEPLKFIVLDEKAKEVKKPNDKKPNDTTKKDDKKSNDKKPNDKKPNDKNSNDKKDKKKDEKKPKGNADEGVNVSLAEIRVGLVKKVEKHPKADKLYVEEINVGEKEPRVICSGLVPYLSTSDIQDKLVLVFCNLKPKPAVGVTSFGMVLCATDPSTGKVELVKVPQGCEPGERVTFGDGYKGEPAKQLNSKRFAKILPLFSTNSNGEVCWNSSPSVTSKGPCTSNFKNAKVS